MLETIILFTIIGITTSALVYALADKKSLSDNVQILLMVLCGVFFISAPQLLLATATNFYPFVELETGSVFDSLSTYVTQNPWATFGRVIQSCIATCVAGLITGIIFLLLRLFKELSNVEWCDESEKISIGTMFIFLAVFSVVLNIGCHSYFSSEKYKLTIESSEEVVKSLYWRCSRAVVIQKTAQDKKTAIMDLDCIGDGNYDFFNGLALKHKDEFFEEETKLPISIAFQPVFDVNRGTELILTYESGQTPPPNYVAQIRDNWSKILSELPKQINERLVETNTEEYKRLNEWEQVKL